jgi:DNA-binding MarR family transcriptional regulator
MDRPIAAATDQHMMHDVLHYLAGDVDPSGLELARLVHVVANQYDALGVGHAKAKGFSGPRWRLMFRLLAEERQGETGGLSPSYLSRCQNVGKNTISALLRGLEEQGMVERTLDQQDRRFFRIRLTDAGRELILKRAPVWLDRLNGLAAGLSAEEKSELIRLLTTLHGSLASTSREAVPEAAAGD